MPHPPLRKAVSRQGAEMGRTSFGDANTCGPLYLYRLAKDAGGYDAGGAYWGHNLNGLKLYRAVTADGSCERFYDARDRAHAKSRILGDYPRASFVR